MSVPADTMTADQRRRRRLIDPNNPDATGQPTQRRGLMPRQDTSVATNLTNLISENSPYVQQARTSAAKVANRRGLLNSSMAVQAGEQAAISQALPIASQDSAQAQERLLQQRQISSSERMQQAQIGSQQQLQTQQIEANRANLERELGSTEKLAAAENALRRQLQGEQITAAEQQQIRDLNAAEQRLGIQVSSQERLQQEQIGSQQQLQTQQIANQQWLAQFDAQTQERLQGLNLDVQQQMQQLSLDAQQRIASMNVAADERNNAATLAAKFENDYASMVSLLMNNEAIPADARQTYMDFANRVRDSNLALVEAFYGIDLPWGTGEAGASPTSGPWAGTP